MVREVSGLKSRTYEERLTELGMETLEKRSQDQDLVTAYKILNGVRQVPVPEERTHRRRTQHCQSYLKKTEPRRNFFSQRVAERWNKLSLKTKNAPSVNSFKSLLRGGTLPVSSNHLNFSSNSNVLMISTTLDGLRVENNNQTSS